MSTSFVEVPGSLTLATWEARSTSKRPLEGYKRRLSIQTRPRSL